MADIFLLAARSPHRYRAALVGVAMTAAACSTAPAVSVERSMLSTADSDVADRSGVPGDEPFPDIGIDQEVLDSMDELEASLPPVYEPMDEFEPRPDVPEYEPAEEEPAEEAAEEEAVDERAAEEEAPPEFSDDRLQIDDIAWTVPDDNDRWDLDRDGSADTVAPNPSQIIDEALPAAGLLGSAWDSDYRSTSIVGGGSIVPAIDTDCDEYDLLARLNSEYHGIQSWVREGEAINAYVVALDDSVQAAGLAAMLGDLSTTCPTIWPESQGAPSEPFEVFPLPTSHDGLDSVLIEVGGTSERLVARSHGALLHIVTLPSFVDIEPSELALTDFATIVDDVVATTPGVEPAVDPSTSDLSSALPTGNDAGLEWYEPYVHEPFYGTQSSRFSCDARAAHGVAQDQLQVAVNSYDAYAFVALGEFDSAVEAGDTMVAMAELSTCPPPVGSDESNITIVHRDTDITASGHPVVPFAYDEQALDGFIMDGATLTVGPYVATVLVIRFADSFDPDAAAVDELALQRQLQLIVDHTVGELEALS